MAIAYMTQGKKGALDKIAEPMSVADAEVLIAQADTHCGAVVTRTDNTITAEFGDMVCFIAICNNQGEFYRAAYAAGWL